MTGRKLRFALAGCGRISKNHFAAIRQHAERAEIAAVCDVEATALSRAVEITVDALALGLTRTKAAVAGVPQAHFDFVMSRQSVKRSGEPEDQAAACSFLVFEESGFMSGQTMLVDGDEGHV